MKNSVIFCFSLLWSMLSFKGWSQESESYRVFIIQDDLRQEILYNESLLRLKKKPFQLELQLKKGLEGVSVSISYDKLYYDIPLNEHFFEWSTIPSRTMAEEANNTDKDIIISKESICYWYYEEGQPCRMDQSIQLTNDSIVGTVTVENFTDEASDSTFPVKKIKKPLYLVFFYYDSVGYEATEEHERKKIQLVFE